MLVYWFFCKCSCLLFYSLPIVVMSSLNLTHRLGSLSYRARKRENVFPVENCYHFNRNWLDSHRTPNVLPPYLGLVRWPSYVAKPLFFVLPIFVARLQRKAINSYRWAARFCRQLFSMNYQASEMTVYRWGDQNRLNVTCSEVLLKLKASAKRKTSC